MATICGQKTNLPNYEARRAAQQIRCGHDWLSQNKLSVLCSSSKGHDLWSEWFIHLFHLGKQDVNSSNVNKYKHTP